MKNKLFYLSIQAFIYLIPITANAIDIKLQCDVVSKITYISGETEEQRGLALIEINDYGNKKYLFVSSALDSLNNLTFTTQSPRFITNDFSNENKWDIEQVGTETSTILSSIARIIIDRNSGTLLVSRDVTFTSRKSMQFATSGNCKKINTSVKKF